MNDLVVIRADEVEYEVHRTQKPESTVSTAWESLFSETYHEIHICGSRAAVALTRLTNETQTHHPLEKYRIVRIPLAVVVHVNTRNAPYSVARPFYVKHGSIVIRVAQDSHREEALAYNVERPSDGENGASKINTRT